MLENKQKEHQERTEKLLSDTNYQRITLGAGCFWGVEHALSNVDGVMETAVGYSGGKTRHPNYRQVCSGNTGHAEVVEVIYDPEKTGLKEILKRFFEIHDPTTLNRQGPDVGSQYRSAIYYHSEDQLEVAKKLMEELKKSGEYQRPIVTEVSPAQPFFRAEEYHQQYNRKNGRIACG